MAAAEEPWEVFARHDPRDPIRHVGTVDATSLSDAEVFSTTLYEEWKWLELFIAPRRAVVDVIRPA